MRRRRLGALSFSFGHASRGLVRLLLAQIFDGLLGAPFACFRGLIVSRALAAVGGRAAVGCDSTVTVGFGSIGALAYPITRSPSAPLPT